MVERIGRFAAPSSYNGLERSLSVFVKVRVGNECSSIKGNSVSLGTGG
jgi:hypothetical protein